MRNGSSRSQLHLTGRWTARAVMRHDLAVALREISAPFTAVSTGDHLAEIAPRLASLRPDIELVSVPQKDFGLFEVEPVMMAELARKTFDGDGRQT